MSVLFIAIRQFCNPELRLFLRFFVNNLINKAGITWEFHVMVSETLNYQTLHDFAAKKAVLNLVNKYVK